MTRLVKLANNAVTRLAGNITNVATTLSVTPGDGAKFPALSAGQFFMATLANSSGNTEVIKVTARSTDTFTFTRAAEPVGGVSTAYAFTAGDRVEMRLTAGALGDELDRLDAAALTSALNKSANYTVTAADVTSLVRVTTTTGAITITLPQISTLTDDFDVVVAKVTSDTNNVLITRSGSDLINGASTYALASQWQCAWLIADRSTNTWTAINSGNGIYNTTADRGTGTGSASITLSGDPVSVNNTAFFVGGVYQQKNTYTMSGTTLTAGGAIPSGVTWEVVWSAPVVLGVPSDGSVSTAKLADQGVTAAKLNDAAISDKIHAATSKTTPVDADEIDLVDSAASFGLKKLTWANLKATLKTYFDALYQSSTAPPSIQGAAKNLVVYATGTSSTVIATVDEICVEDSSNKYKTLRNVSVSASVATTGLNGIDIGSSAANTWYSVWVIHDGTNTGALLSLHATAPTLPGIYTHKARIGWIRTDSSGNKYPLSFKQCGTLVHYAVAAGSNVTSIPKMATGTAGSVDTPTWVSVAWSAFAPPTASALIVAARQYASASPQGVLLVAPSNSFGAIGSTTNPPPQMSSGGASDSMTNVRHIIESSNIYWASQGSANNFIACYGWEDNL